MIDNLLVYFTFPGTILHELSHVIICHIRNVHIINKCYFRLPTDTDIKMGFVEHEVPTKLIDSFLISFAPISLIFIALFLYYIAIIFNSQLNLWVIPILWLAFSIGSQALPSKSDLDNVYYKCVNKIQKKDYSPIIYLPAIHIAYICSSLTTLWFNFIFSIGLYYLIIFIINS
jgi:hypothetical protein